MARDIKKVYDKVMKNLSNNLKKKLENDSSFWAPESFAYQLTMWVNGHVTPDSTSERSVKVYAALCGCTTAEMKENFIKNGD